jgi:hypothetical protein
VSRAGHEAAAVRPGSGCGRGQVGSTSTLPPSWFGLDELASSTITSSIYTLDHFK